MSIKLVITFLCTAVGTATGYMIMRSFKRNYEYLKELCGAVAELKNNLAYKRDGAAGVLGGMTFKSAQLSKNVCEYIAYAGGKDSAPKISRGFLPPDVYANANEFFSSLGASDGNSQINALNMYAEKFGAMCSAAEEKSKKLGGVAVKLGFLIGLGVGILVL